MASFDSVNYSIRPSKSVQRGIVFDGLRALCASMNLHDTVYIGFGSIWFTDFLMAHKVLGIDEMISIEASPVGYKRAEFNKVYRSISVLEGRSDERLPEIAAQVEYQARPWIVWLDYDGALDEQKVEEMRWLLLNAPPNSIVLFTFSATQNAYGARPAQRPGRVSDILGAVVPDDLTREDCSKENLPQTLATLTMDFLSSVVADNARPGGFIRSFQIPYFDSVGMVTVGGVLPGLGAAPAARAIVAEQSWKGIVDEMIEAPPMTLKEVATLQAELPFAGELTRDRVQELGFDLLEHQIRSFQRYYKYLPSFAEIVA
ncbi:hypothetical protein Q4511_15890 [Paracoccus sp. 1_MG-2023]|uniref:O-methyltransferase n=1 Tax=unclassified Paracoccus (in: a-proteobacteria) TaxID=2688777 RepID=UPI0020912A12|nr:MULTISPECIES: O-methyltransferase [unclassified Paracoccus (in: a-proteobacteria)]MDO6670399.1 hypothetical protein [Paracoccus sp. 1_MG-2023]